MRFFFARSILSKKEKIDASEYERPANIKFLLGIILFATLFFAFNLNFEVKLNNILAQSSQIDETKTLSTIDRLIINRKARALKKETGVDLAFYITQYEVQKITPSEQSLYIEINTRENTAQTTLPFENHAIQARLTNNLQTCIKYDEIGSCMADTIESLHNILTSNEQRSSVQEYKADFVRE